jgi:hypothetical protein
VKKRGRDSGGGEWGAGVCVCGGGSLAPPPTSAKPTFGAGVAVKGLPPSGTVPACCAGRVGSGVEVATLPRPP